MVNLIVILDFYIEFLTNQIFTWTRNRSWLTLHFYSPIVRDLNWFEDAIIAGNVYEQKITERQPFVPQQIEAENEDLTVSIHSKSLL